MVADPICPTNFKDRKKGLVIFGIIRLLFGGMGAIPIFFAIINNFTTTSPDASSTSRIITALLFFILQTSMVFWYIITGIGSIKILRWSRVLILYSSWIELIITICEYIILSLILFIHGITFEYTIMPSLPTTIIGVIVTVFFIVFYSSKDVKATYEFRDRKFHWIDKYPILVPFIVLLFGLCAISWKLLDMLLRG
jgi:hypothetical protein